MKLTLTYETQVDVVVDLDKGKVESIAVFKELGSPISGIEGFIHVSSDSNPFYHSDTKNALHVLKSNPHPKWTFKEVK